ncbi:MAG: flagellar basal-body MS-ring/collar protein FliF [Pseudomonadales bacterium]
MAAAESATLKGFTGFSGLHFLRQVGLMVGLAASVAIGFGVVLWSQEGDFRPLYGSMENLNTDEIMGVLDGDQIKYKIDASSGSLLVEADQLHRVRLKLAARGFGAQSPVGMEMLDQEQPLGTSQFLETARYRRGLEGELARTIGSIHAVRSARVHLAIPARSVFVRDARKPRASVFLELFAGRNITPAQVKAIRNMVSSSIAELSTEEVTIVDQLGNLLSNADVGQDFEMAGKQLDYVRKVEGKISDRVTSILQPIIGAGNYRAEVTAEVDFTQMEQTDEIFNPDLPSVRSEATLEEQRAGGEGAASGVPGALSNQPPEEATVNGSPAAGANASAGSANGAGTSRKQSTRNYELDRTISHTRHQVGKLQRLSVAVVVNNLPVSDAAEGEATSKAWEPAELERITQLVKDAVGFNATRGDSVNVINSAFVQVADLPAPDELAIWQQPWFMTTLKQVGGGLFVLILVFGVLRPVLRNLSAGVKTIPALTDASTGEGAAAPQSAMADELLQSEPAVTLSGGGDAAMLPNPGGSFEQQLDSIKTLIADDPNRVAQVIKKWVADGD